MWIRDKRDGNEYLMLDENEFDYLCQSAAAVTARIPKKHAEIVNDEEEETDKKVILGSVEEESCPAFNGYYNGIKKGREIEKAKALVVMWKIHDIYWALVHGLAIDATKEKEKVSNDMAKQITDAIEVYREGK